MRVKKFNSSKVEDHFRLFNFYGFQKFDRRVFDQSLYYDITQLKNFFFKFLDATSTGFDWYFENKLQDVKHLIYRDKPGILDVYLPKRILNAAQEPTDSYILYKKGV